MSAESYPGARRLAEAFDADLILQLSALDDCSRIVDPDRARSTHFVATSQPLHEYIQSHLELAADRTSIIRPGVLARSDVTCFKYGDRMATILCTARLEAGMGIDELIEAVAALRKRGRGILLFLLGRGRYDGALRRMVRERQLSACVTLADAAGATDAALESADIHVNPTMDTRFTVGGLQAMAAGVVVVTTKNPACDHFIDGETCVVCPDGSTGAIIDAIERVVTDRARAQRLARGGLEYVRKHHSISAMADQFAGLYRRLVLARATIKMPE
jgi:glycosyltransferase involved in cell wall biosynthesis